MTSFDEWRTTVRRDWTGCPIPSGHPLRDEWKDAWAYYDLGGPRGMLAVERAYWAEITARQKIAADLTRAEVLVTDATNPTSPAKTQVGSESQALRKGA